MVEQMMRVKRKVSIHAPAKGATATILVACYIITCNIHSANRQKKANQGFREIMVSNDISVIISNDKAVYVSWPCFHVRLGFAETCCTIEILQNIECLTTCSGFFTAVCELGVNYIEDVVNDVFGVNAGRKMIVRTEIHVTRAELSFYPLSLNPLGITF